MKSSQVKSAACGASGLWLTNIMFFSGELPSSLCVSCQLQYSHSWTVVENWSDFQDLLTKEWPKESKYLQTDY